AAARRVGAGRLEELTIEAPVIVPRQGGIAVQVLVGALDDAGRRSVDVYASEDGIAWTRSATGALGSGSARGGEAVAAWPPVGADPIDLSGLYERLAAHGLSYGPVFRGLRAAWRRGDEVLAEVALPESVASSGYALHPALTDAALHALAAAAPA